MTSAPVVIICGRCLAVEPLSLFSILYSSAVVSSRVVITVATVSMAWLIDSLRSASAPVERRRPQSPTNSDRHDQDDERDDANSDTGRPWPSAATSCHRERITTAASAQRPCNYTKLARTLLLITLLLQLTNHWRLTTSSMSPMWAASVSCAPRHVARDLPLRQTTTTATTAFARACSRLQAVRPDGIQRTGLYFTVVTRPHADPLQFTYLAVPLLTHAGGLRYTPTSFAVCRWQRPQLYGRRRWTARWRFTFRDCAAASVRSTDICLTRQYSVAVAANGRVRSPTVTLCFGVGVTNHQHWWLRLWALQCSRCSASTVKGHETLRY